jgi:hypothetical protein
MVTTSSDSRPLVRISILVAAVLVAGTISLALSLVLALLLIFWVLLLTGAIAVSAHPSRRKQHKPMVFCVGLSRTGTTSITVALHNLGYSSYHMYFPLVRFADWEPGRDNGNPPALDVEAAKHFDCHSDIAPAIVYRQLADAFPDSKFVLTSRDPERWGLAMASFMSHHKFLFSSTTYPPVGKAYVAT